MSVDLSDYSPAERCRHECDQRIHEQRHWIMAEAGGKRDIVFIRFSEHITTITLIGKRGEEEGILG